MKITFEIKEGYNMEALMDLMRTYGVAISGEPGYEIHTRDIKSVELSDGKETMRAEF